MQVVTAITPAVGGYDIKVDFLQEDGKTVLTAKTSVGCKDEVTAEAYVNEILIPDLRRNDPLCTLWPVEEVEEKA